MPSGSFDHVSQSSTPVRTDPVEDGPQRKDGSRYHFCSLAGTDRADIGGVSVVDGEEVGGGGSRVRPSNGSDGDPSSRPRYPSRDGRDTWDTSPVTDRGERNGTGGHWTDSQSDTPTRESPQGGTTEVLLWASRLAPTEHRTPCLRDLPVPGSFLRRDR